MKHKKRIFSEAGFTLIEITMVIVILAVFAGTWIGAKSWFTGGWNICTVRQDLLSEGSVALNRMLREMRRVKNRAAIKVAEKDRFAFIDNDDNLISFRYKVENKRLEYGVCDKCSELSELENNYHSLAEGVIKFKLVYLQCDGNIIETPYITNYTNIRLIRIQVTLSKNNEELALRTGVAPRNLQFK
ncbi:MAG: type II secretion system protein [bacterium]